MSRDFLRQRTAAMNPEVARNLVLSEIEAKLQSEGKSLDDFKLPQVDEELILEFRSPLLNAELNYDIPALQREVDQAERTLNVDQRAAFNAVYESIFEEGSKSKVFLLNAAGGSGKTFLLNHILNAVRLKSQVALATATA